MKYLVKVHAGDGKVETYTTEAPDAAAAMLQAYDKYGVCGVTVSPVGECDACHGAGGLGTGEDADSCGFCNGTGRASSACPVDTAIANLDALLAERRDAIAQRNAS